MNPLLILLLVLLLIILPIGIYVLCLIFAGKRTDISEENSKTGEDAAQKVGKKGECLVAQQLGRNIDGVRYVINNFIFADGKSSVQIDHILIETRGVFVIETKNYSGCIYGNDEWKEWTQSLDYGQIKNKFYNPVKQNKQHILHLRCILPRGTPLHSIVVFVQNNTEHIKSKYTVPLCGLKHRIVSYPEHALSPAKINKIYLILLRHMDTVSEEEHIYRVQNTQRMINANICPRCGGNLILRNNKYGYFWGCENYPKCRFIKK